MERKRFTAKVHQSPSGGGALGRACPFIRRPLLLALALGIALAAISGLLAPAQSLAAEDSDDTVAVYALYNQWSGEHHYTTDEGEYDNFGIIGWSKLGVAWYAPATSSTPVYLLYDPSSGRHLFTASMDEYEAYESYGWVQQGVSFYSDDAQTVPVYRLRNESWRTFIYTTVQDDYDEYTREGMAGDGVVFYGVADGDRTPDPTPRNEGAKEVTFDANGGHFGDDESATTKSMSWPQYYAPNYVSFPEGVSREGYVLAGWAKTPDATVDDIVIGVEEDPTPFKSYSAYSNGTLYAVWKADPTSDPDPSDVKFVVMYRLYNRWSGEHLFTADEDEYDSLGLIGWNQEGEAWVSPATSDTPVYRLYNSWSGDHFYTKDYGEYVDLGRIGWNQEGIAFYSAGEDGLPIYRLYNPYVEVGTHLFTTDADEYDQLQPIGWRGEGIAFYGVA